MPYANVHSERVTMTLRLYDNMHCATPLTREYVPCATPRCESECSVHACRVQQSTSVIVSAIYLCTLQTSSGGARLVDRIVLTHMKLH